jgi:hypothetical protein
MKKPAARKQMDETQMKEVLQRNFETIYEFDFAWTNVFSPVPVYGPTRPN